MTSIRLGDGLVHARDVAWIARPQSAVYTACEMVVTRALWEARHGRDAPTCLACLLRVRLFPNIRDEWGL